jgi:hypothetical protein
MALKNSPLFWIVVGAGGVYAYHHWVKPLPAAATPSS